MDRFTRGLEKFSISKVEIERGDWVYSGGSEGRHLRYWKLRTKGEKTPDLDDHCVCGHAIRENCYIENSKDPNDIQILVLGNCCIKRFLPKEASGRTCEKCRSPHRNRKDNLCHPCRKMEKMEMRTAETVKRDWERIPHHRGGPVQGVCASCKTPVKKGRNGKFYKRCYPCSRDHMCPMCQKCWVPKDFNKCFECSQKPTECETCNDTGEQYWAAGSDGEDDIFGWCMDCGRGFPEPEED